MLHMRPLHCAAHSPSEDPASLMSSNVMQACVSLYSTNSYFSLLMAYAGLFLFSFFFFKGSGAPGDLPSSPTRRSPDLQPPVRAGRQRREQLVDPAVGDRPGDPLGHRRPVASGPLGPPLVHRVVVRVRADRTLPADGADRKSTRLNSSHT